MLYVRSHPLHFKNNCLSQILRIEIVYRFHEISPSPPEMFAHSYSALLTTLLLLTLSSTTLASPPQALTQRDSTVAIIGTFADARCTAGQKDWSDGVAKMPGVGKCHELPGEGVKMWWAKKGCFVLMFPGDRTCSVDPTTVTVTDKCVDTKGYLSWTAYCQ
ncbi:hypothetical protein FB567DRAFT_540956 [Paraphoma chrysanthemicola]|uniref:Uncharacterized protein n=1 Tax=Paraphoma chrysanthemicola TaxID=798071 RepID=A0A8K0VSF6_9PLEO|nr:hypothetical protein FB567DRAFT_540956 [Paraphoma chrysanthemicola]